MYVKTFDSVRIRIEDKDMKKLLKRFNANEFKVSSDKRSYVNKTACALCTKYNKGDTDCSICPFAPFEMPDTTNVHAKHGCSVVMDKLLHPINSGRYRAIFVPMPAALYYTVACDRALKELQAITDFLESFEKEQ